MRKYLLLAVLAGLLIPLGANAAPREVPNVNASMDLKYGKNYTDYVRFDAISIQQNASEVRLYFLGFVDHVTKTKTTPSKYLKLVIAASSGHLTTGDGQIYWLKKNLSNNFDHSQPLQVAVRVSPKITKGNQHCMMTRLVEVSNDGQTYTVPVGRGFCMSGKQWLPLKPGR